MGKTSAIVIRPRQQVLPSSRATLARGIPATHAARIVKPLGKRPTTAARKRSPQVFNIPHELIQAAKSHRLALLVGAGLSRQAKTSHKNAYPNWKGLLDELHNEAIQGGRLSKTESGEIAKLLSDGSYLMAAQILVGRLPKDSYESLLERLFDPPDALPGEVHTALFRLKPSIVLTTNYDDLLETAFASMSSKNIVPFTYNESSQAHRRLRCGIPPEYPLIFKMHGTISKPGDVILTEYDYRKLIYQKPGYRTLMSAIFVTHTVLMLGFSLRDRELSLLLESLQESFDYEKRADYILLPTRSGKKSLEMKRIEDDFGVHIVPYKSSKRHRAVLDFINQLVDEAGFGNRK